MAPGRQLLVKHVVLLFLYDNNKFQTFRLHLSVSALRELIKTLTFHRERGLENEDLQYLEELQSKLVFFVFSLRIDILWLIQNALPLLLFFSNGTSVLNHNQALIGMFYCVNWKVCDVKMFGNFAKSRNLQTFPKAYFFPSSRTLFCPFISSYFLFF